MCTQGANGQTMAIPLSTDQKPERADEKARILAHGGRVEPLPGPPGECGPARVWLAEADVPGLAMYVQPRNQTHTVHASQPSKRRISH